MTKPIKRKNGTTIGTRNIKGKEVRCPYCQKVFVLVQPKQKRKAPKKKTGWEAICAW